MPVTDFYTDVVKFFFIDSPHFIKNSLTKVGKGRLLRPRVIYFFFFAKWDQPFQTILYAWELPGNQTDVHKQFKQKKQVLHGVHLEPVHVMKRRSLDQQLRVKIYYDTSVYKWVTATLTSPSQTS